MVPLSAQMDAVLGTTMGTVNLTAKQLREKEN